MDINTVHNVDNLIYAKKLNNNFEVKAYAKEKETLYIWDILIITNKIQSTYTFSITKKDLGESYPFTGFHFNFWRYLKVIDVFFDEKNRELFVVFDKFGQIDVHKNKLNIDFSYDENQKTEITTTRQSEIYPMGVSFDMGYNLDLKMYNHCIYAIYTGVQGGSYFLNKSNIINNLSEEVFIDFIDFKSRDSTKKIKDIELVTVALNDNNRVRELIEKSLKKTQYKEEIFTYETYLKPLNSDLVFFFIRINRKSKLIIINEFNNKEKEEWYIGDYNEYLYNKHDKNYIVKDINSKIKYAF